LPAINGGVMAAGGLGALTATFPVEIALGITDWRGVFLGLSVVTLGLASLIYLVVPERSDHAVRDRMGDLAKGMVAIFRSLRFWRVAPATVMSQGSFMAIQGLWLGPWLKDVAGLDREGVATYLLFTAAAMAIGFFAIGQLGERLARLGIKPIAVAGSGMCAFALVQVAIVSGLGGMVPLLWVLFGFFGASGSLCYAVLSQSFPKALAGRVNTAMNFLLFVGTFVIQWAIGAVINLWPAAHGRYDPRGYLAAFGLCAALQGVALAWFLLAERRVAGVRDV
jgi:predicted MFS family arabinose efflux permease